MALKNFITQGSYSRINSITVNKEPARIDFDLVIYDQEGGNILFGPFAFSVDYKTEIDKYKAENPVSIAAPEYPQVCADREAMTPMWTDENTAEEIDEYWAAKDQYDADMLAYNDALLNAEDVLDTTAATMNKYTQYFSDEKIYVDGNATAQAYLYLKNQPGFDGVADV